VNDEDRELVIRRILVALDASPGSLAALGTATRLAELFHAELRGLYVEDVNLLRASELPFTREIGIHSGAQRRLDLGEIERQLREQAELARRALTDSARRARVRSSFRISRGAVISELITAASEMDLVIVGKSGWSPIERRRLGSTARDLLTQATRPALVLERGSRLRHPLAVVCDGSALGQRALQVAATLARREGSQGRGVVARYRTLHEWTASRVAEILKEDSAGGLVVPATEAVLEDEELLTLLTETDTPVLLVR
jgi:nucleotide-binding universal stress UspA family protein